MDDVAVEPKDRVIKMGDREIDLTQSGPLKWKDVKALQRLGVEDAELTRGNPEHIEKFVLYILQRIDPDITLEDIDELEVADLQSVVQSFGQQAQEVNASQRPI